MQDVSHRRLHTEGVKESQACEESGGELQRPGRPGLRGAGDKDLEMQKKERKNFKGTNRS